jgi:ASC-1-like (ASCH) protein
METSEYTIGIRENYFNLIKNGTKPIEGRINTGICAKLKIGDIINFKCNNTGSLLKTRIIRTETYPSFDEMLTSEGVDKMLPDINNLQQGINIYESIKGYKAKCKKFGCIAIQINII